MSVSLQQPPAVAAVREQAPEKHRSRCSELCSVCGDQSTGFHYEVASCNGCKTFFRRTIVSERTFRCHKNGNCLFNKDIRCACRACRFKKCLEVGMNPKAIQTTRPGFVSKESSPSLTPSPDQIMSREETQRAQYMAGTISKKALRKRTYDISSLLDMEQPSCSSNSRSSSPLDNVAQQNKLRELSQRLEAVLDTEDRLCFLRKSDFVPAPSLLDVLTRPCALEDIRKYEPSLLHFVTTDADLDKETNLVLEHIKSFKWFKDMCFTDKFTLLCDRTIFMLCLRVAYRKSNQMIDEADILTKRLMPIVDAMRRLGMDRTTFALVNTILLFDCDNFALTIDAKEILVAEKQKVVAVLGEHFFTKYGGFGAAQLTDHLALLWTVMHSAHDVKEELMRSLPTTSLTRQIIDPTIY